MVVVGLTDIPHNQAFFQIPSSSREPLLTIALLAAAAAAVTAVAGGVTRATYRDPSDPPRDLIHPPGPPAGFRAPKRTRKTTLGGSRDPGTILLRALAVFADQTGYATRMMAAL